MHTSDQVVEQLMAEAHDKDQLRAVVDELELALQLQRPWAVRTSVLKKK